MNGDIYKDNQQETGDYRQNDPAHPEDKQGFVFCPNPLEDAPAGAEQLLRDTMDFIQDSGLYKDFLGSGREDYYRMELSYILSAPAGDAPEEVTAVGVCLGAEDYPEDEMTFQFRPYTGEKPVWLWGANSWRDLYEPLESGCEILYMSIGCHAALWAEMAEDKPDIQVEPGVAKYLQHCAANGITPERMLENDLVLADDVEAVTRMMDDAISSGGMVMM